MCNSRIRWMLAATLLPALVFAQPACWYPDGRTPAPNDVPCNSTAKVSACCGSGALCMGNGVCLEGGVLSRGSCTDQRWLDSSCAPYCQESNPEGGSPIMNCFSGLTQRDNKFICGLYPGNCSNASMLFTMSNTDEYVLRADQLSSAEAAAGVATATSGPTGSATAKPSTTHSTTASSKNGYSAGAMAGVGVGIGVPLLIVVGVLSFLLVREKKRHRAQAATTFNGTAKHDIDPSPQISYQQPYQQTYAPQQVQQTPVVWPAHAQPMALTQQNAELPAHDQPRELPTK